MKAIFKAPVLNERNFTHVNRFMSAVRMANGPFDLIDRLYKENILPDGFKDTDMHVKIWENRVRLYEVVDAEDGEEEEILYVPLTRIEV